MKKTSFYLIALVAILCFLYLKSQKKPGRGKIKKLASSYVSAIYNNDFEEAKTFIYPECLAYYDRLGIMLPKIIFESSVNSVGNRLCKQDIKELVVSVTPVPRAEKIDERLIKERYGVRKVWYVCFYCPYADYSEGFFLAKDEKSKKWYLLLSAYNINEIMKITPELDESSMHNAKRIFKWQMQQRKRWLSGSG